MKKFFVLFFVYFASLSFAQNKSIISSEIRWKGYKTLKAESLSHYGTIKLKSGNFIFKNNEIAGGTFTMDMMTMDAEDLNNDPKLKKMFENHLKSDDFFDSKNFPVSTFQIKSIKKLNNNSAQVNGVLTIKGISKNVSFPVKVSENNNITTISSGTFTFNRKNFGLKYNIFEDMLISNDVEMSIKFQLR